MVAVQGAPESVHGDVDVGIAAHPEQQLPATAQVHRAIGDQPGVGAGNRLFPKAKMTEAEQVERIKARLVQAGKIANMRERPASVSDALVGRCARSARCTDKLRTATSDRVQRRS